MIGAANRCVIQRVGFLGPRAYRRHGPAYHAPITVSTQETTFQGLHSAGDAMEIQPGEVVAVWDLPADEDRSFDAVIQDLPPVPSRLLVHTSDRQMLELNPEYIAIHEGDETDEPMPDYAWD
jgi:hypothetical protein